MTALEPVTMTVMSEPYSLGSVTFMPVTVLNPMTVTVLGPAILTVLSKITTMTVWGPQQLHDMASSAWLGASCPEWPMSLSWPPHCTSLSLS